MRSTSYLNDYPQPLSLASFREHSPSVPVPPTAKPRCSCDEHPPVVREPKLIIPTTISKFTAVDRNVFARGTKYTVEFPRRLSSPSSSFSLLLLLLPLSTATSSRPSVLGNTNRSSIRKSCQNSKVREMNSSVLYPFGGKEEAAITV